MTTATWKSSTRLLKKEKIGTHTTKKYNKPLTPYKRLLKLNVLSESQKQQLSLLFNVRQRYDVPLPFYVRQYVHFMRENYIGIKYEP